MKTKSYKIFVVFSTILLLFSLIFMAILKNKSNQNSERYFFDKIIVTRSDAIDFKNLTPLESEILNKFKKIPKNEYFFRYEEIAENNRVLLNSPVEKRIGAYILKEMLNSNNLPPNGRLFILHKLIILVSSSENIVNTITLTIEYLNLAQDLKSEYDIVRAKLSLAYIFSTLEGYETAIKILNDIDIENRDFSKISSVKSSLYLYLSENYFFLKKYDLAIKALEKIDTSDFQSLEYKKNTEALKNIFFTRIYLSLNNKELAKKNIESATYLINNLEKFYFTDLKLFYALTLESYYLKYDLNSFSPKKVRNFIDASHSQGDAQLLKTAFKLLMNYYFEVKDFDQYKILSVEYDSYLNKINSNNNNLFSLYLIESLERERFAKENESLYRDMSILVISMLVILAISYIRVISLDFKTKIDPLTGIGNRLAFNIKLKTLKNKDFSMLLFDIDNFKNINDTYGHEFGDEVLSTIGKVLQAIENKEISIYRVGGEEFAIIFNHLNKNFAIESCEYIRKSIENIHWVNPITVTISGGFATATKNIYAECDTRLYKAKNSGKNMIIYQTVDNGGF